MKNYPLWKIGFPSPDLGSRKICIWVPVTDFNIYEYFEEMLKFFVKIRNFTWYNCKTKSREIVITINLQACWNFVQVAEQPRQVGRVGKANQECIFFSFQSIINPSRPWTDATKGNKSLIWLESTNTKLSVGNKTRSFRWNRSGDNEAWWTSEIDSSCPVHFDWCNSGVSDC